MNAVINSSTGVLIDYVENIEHVENGWKVIKGSSGYIYSPAEEFIVIETILPEGVEPQKYSYIEGKFTLNPSYAPPAKKQIMLTRNGDNVEISILDKEGLQLPQEPVMVTVTGKDNAGNAFEQITSACFDGVISLSSFVAGDTVLIQVVLYNADMAELEVIV